MRARWRAGTQRRWVTGCFLPPCELATSSNLKLHAVLRMGSVTNLRADDCVEHLISFMRANAGQPCSADRGKLGGKSETRANALQRTAVCRNSPDQYASTLVGCPLSQFSACITIERAWHRCVGFEVGNVRLRRGNNAAGREAGSAPPPSSLRTPPSLLPGGEKLCSAAASSSSAMTASI